jgi:hypothetical protein
MRRLKRLNPGVNCFTNRAILMMVRAKTYRVFIIISPSGHPTSHHVMDGRGCWPQTRPHADAAAFLHDGLKAPLAFFGVHDVVNINSHRAVVATPTSMKKPHIIMMAQKSK